MIHVSCAFTLILASLPLLLSDHSHLSLTFSELRFPFSQGLTVDLRSLLLAFLVALAYVAWQVLRPKSNL